MFMAKCRWVENGERSTKYYLNLKNRNYKKRPLISELRLQGKFTTCNEKEIPRQIVDHFKNLYYSSNTGFLS